MKHDRNKRDRIINYFLWFVLVFCMTTLVIVLYQYLTHFTKTNVVTADSLPTNTLSYDEQVGVALFGLLTGTVSSMLVLIFKIRLEDKETKALNKLIKYSRQRKEIEKEIAFLTSELSTSNISEYVDLNRMAFSGQSYNPNYSGIDYQKFLEQFGIQRDSLKVQHSTALFLTPFNKDGESLYRQCQMVLDRIGIYLRRTDNVVKKDDILMNIVEAIVQAEIIIVNIDGRNPNVYYELGIAHAIGKPTILLSKVDYSSIEMENIGFDIRQKRIVMYKNWEELEKQLLYQVNRLRVSATDSIS